MRYGEGGTASSGRKRVEVSEKNREEKKKSTNEV